MRDTRARSTTDGRRPSPGAGRRARFGALLLAALSVSASAGWAASGDLDASFAGDGTTSTAVGISSLSDFFGVAVQADGKIVLSGQSWNGSDFDFAVVRYNADGSLDTSFDGDGVAVTPIGLDHDYGHAVALQTDGRILVSGFTDSGIDNDIALVRYNTDGTLDTSFDGDGKAVTAVGASHDYGYGVALQTDGKILVSGSTGSNGSRDIALVRYNTEGTLDTSFDGDGRAVTSIGAGDDSGYGLAIQADGAIIVSGSTINGGNSDVAVVRYLTDGTLDPSFDGDGRTVTSIGTTDDYGYGVALQTDGKIVVTGSCLNGPNNGIALVRYNSDGTLDASLDGDGTVVTTVGAGLSEAFAVAVQPTGKILVAGRSYFPSGPSNGTGVVLRYTASGSLDPTFVGSGYAVVPIQAGFQNDFFGIALQADGRIVVAGNTWNGSNFEFAAARLLDDTACGNALIEPGEQCDDGNAAGGDCCSASCQFEADGSPCAPDGATCTADICDGSGTCTHPGLATGCLAAGRSSVRLSNAADETRDQLLWKWVKGAALGQTDFADPTNGTGYTLCIFAGTSNALIAEAVLPPGSGWSALGSKGYKFRGTTAGGLSDATLKGGAASHSKAVVKGKGMALPDPALPLAYPVTIQLRKGGSPLCLESVFHNADEVKNDSTLFKARQ